MSEAIGMIETKGYTGNVEATDAMAKAANITITKTISIGGGLITVICKGDVASVKAAVDAGSKAAGKVGELVASHVIARPHEDLGKIFFGAEVSKLLDIFQIGSRTEYSAFAGEDDDSDILITNKFIECVGNIAYGYRLAGDCVQLEAEPQEQSGRTMIYSNAGRIAEPLEERAMARAQTALLLVDGRRLVVGPAGATVGRSRQCDIVLSDPNISRQHAEVRPRGGSWVVSDLGSTNGSRLNGRRIEHPEVIRPGDEIELGATVLRFELE